MILHAMGLERVGASLEAHNPSPKNQIIEAIVPPAAKASFSLPTREAEAPPKMTVISRMA